MIVAMASEPAGFFIPFFIPFLVEKRSESFGMRADAQNRFFRVSVTVRVKGFGESGGSGIASRGTGMGWEDTPRSHGVQEVAGSNPVAPMSSSKGLRQPA